MNAKLEPYREIICGEKIPIKDDNPQSKSSITLLNKSHSDYWKVKIDGDVYKKGSPETRCDVYVEHANLHHEYFIELKGKHHIDEGYTQLITSIDEFSEVVNKKKKDCNTKLRAFIVPIEIPSHSTNVQKLQRQFKFKYGKGQDLVVCSSGHSYDLDKDKVI